MDNVRMQISYATENMATVVYEVLSHIYDQIVMLKNFNVVDKRLNIMFNYLMTSFKKIYFNRAAEIFVKIFD